MKHLTTTVAVVAVALASVGCDKQVNPASGQGTPTPAKPAAVDPQQVEMFKRDLPVLRAAITRCTSHETVECLSARRANYELMFAPAPAASATGFRGGSRDLRPR